MRLPMPQHLSSAPRVTTPAQLDARYLNHRAFLAQAQVGAEACRFFVSTPLTPPQHAPVMVRIEFAGEPVMFMVNGRVVRHESLRTSPRAGVVVEVTGEELEAFGRAYAHARGASEELGRRTFERIATSLRAELITPVGTRLPALVRDLSRTGAFVALTTAQLPEGARVKLVIRVGWFRKLPLDGRVAWCGERRELLGAGVEFRGITPTSQRVLAAVLARARASAQS